VPTVEDLKAVSFPFDPAEGPPKLHRPVGCTSCGHTGYRGRMAVHEVMPVSEEIERLVSEKTSSEHIAEVAREQGMLTLRQDGMEKVRLGLTSIEEILRIVV
jgi:type IV pilus assembly protein PilB